MKIKNQVPILIADDDMDDCMMIKEAFQESRLLNSLQFVHNGEELMHSLNQKLEKQHPLPGLILLDLNMPKKDGREALKEIKNHPKLKQIPVIVLTTSKAEEDVVRTYNIGVNSFITKPVAFESLVQILRDLGRYWFEIVELPDTEKSGN
jgi:CheY-like chemotaxis protein